MLDIRTPSGPDYAGHAVLWSHNSIHNDCHILYSHILYSHRIQADRADHCDAKCSNIIRLKVDHCSRLKGVVSPSNHGLWETGGRGPGIQVNPTLKVFTISVLNFKT